MSHDFYLEFLVASESRPHRERELRAAIRALKLPWPSNRELFATLATRSPWLLGREFYAHQSGGFDETPSSQDMETFKAIRTMLGHTADSDDAAALYAASKWTEGQIRRGELTPSAANARLEKLPRREQKAAIRMGKRFCSQSNAFRTGKPPHPYIRLIIKLALDIERATGERFRFSRTEDVKTGRIGPPSGPMMNVLEAALDLQLIVSDVPSRETIAQILKRLRRVRNLKDRYFESLLVDPIIFGDTLEYYLRQAARRLPSRAF